MKILHLGDLHIGKSVNDYSMIEDQKYMLNQILEIGASRGIDAVLLAGDIYDKSVPSEEAVSVFDYFLCQLAQRRIKTFVISGNHDSDERLNFGSTLFETNDIYIASKYEGKLYRQVVEDEYGRVNIYLLPFVKASQVKHFFPEAEIDSYDKAVRVVLENAGINEKERNILVAHQFVAGKSEEPRLGGSENAAVQHVGTVEKIGADCFDCFDYVALGHIHSPQRVGRNEVRYSGSLLKYSLSEIDNEKSVPLITLGSKGNTDIELIKLRPRREMRHLTGRLEQLLDKKNILSPDDYIYVTLTDEHPIPEAMAIIRQHYPNTMKIDYDNSHTREKEQLETVKAAQEKSFKELIADFYRMMYGCEISGEELKVMLEAAGEAGVADEAD
ncbi:MAG: exonuclease SbcCD subunit D [Bacteroidales bacterium]|nr:exonuclease SbcCD subunit D [Clostridium sp.]MCM1204052.1 exonuclease SbcCD subunit D [Bacteroidales bacterium]